MIRPIDPVWDHHKASCEFCQTRAKPADSDSTGLSGREKPTEVSLVRSDTTVTVLADSSAIETQALSNNDATVRIKDVYHSGSLTLLLDRTSTERLYRELAKVLTESGEADRELLAEASA